MLRRACGHTWGNVDSSSGSSTLIHRITHVSFPAWGRRWITMGTQFRALRWPDTRLCTIHSPYYDYYLFVRPVMRKGNL